MSLAVYAPPRAILTIFNPNDFPNTLVSTTSSTTNYANATATLLTINTSLTTNQSKLQYVGSFPYSQSLPTPNPSSISTGITTIATLYPPGGLIAQPFAVWACATFQYYANFTSQVVPNPFSYGNITFSGGKKTQTTEIYPNSYVTTAGSIIANRYQTAFSFADLPFNQTLGALTYAFQMAVNPSGITAGTNAIYAQNPIINTNANIYFICIK